MATSSALRDRDLARSGSDTVLPVLVAISFCHLLNDMIQSLLPAIYPMLKDVLRARLRPDRADHAGLPAHRLAAAAGGRHLHRPAAAALFAAGRHGLHAGRPAAAVPGADSYPRACCSPRRWSASARRSSIPSPRAWRAWPRAAGTASRSRCSRSAATSARRSARCSPPSSSCRAARAASPGSRSPRCSAMIVLCERRRLVQAAHRRRRRSGGARAASAAMPRCRGGRCSSRSRSSVALIFSKYFYLASLSSYYTFYLIAEVRPVGADRAAPPVRVPGRGRGRHLRRRPDRRPLRPQAGDLGLDPRRPARSR